MFIKTERVIRAVLPPDARDPLIAGLESHGFYTFNAGPGGWAGHGAILGDTAFDAGRMGHKPILDEELPEQEVEATRLVFQVLHQRRRTVHVVDVGRQSSFHRFIEEHLHHLREFPVLVRPDGRRLEGCREFTPEKLEQFLSDDPQAG
jgi:hypothetical protein